VDGVERVHEVREVAVVPAGFVHTAWNAGDGQVHALVEFEPALCSEIPWRSWPASRATGR
jgi:hypothetical protein